MVTPGNAGRDQQAIVDRQHSVRVVVSTRGGRSLFWEVRALKSLTFATGVALLACASLATDARAQTPLQLPDLLERVEPSIVRIETKDGMGSGFIATAQGDVVTNLHVIDGSSEARVLFSDGSSFAVTGILASDEDRDIAILSTTVRGISPLPLASAVPRKGDSVVTFGSPAGLSFSASEGIVSAIRTPAEAKELLDIDGGTWLQTTAPISPGNSGGPLMNRNGEVVGINTFYVQRGQNLNFAISSLDVAELLRVAAKSQPKPLRSKPAVTKRSDPELNQSLLSAAFAAYLARSEAAALQALEATDRRIAEAEEEAKMARAGKVNRRTRYSSTGVRTEFNGNRLSLQFADSAAKERVVKEKEAAVDKLKELKAALEGPDGVLHFAWHAGPKLSLAEPGSIGRVAEVKVSEVTGPEEFHGYLGNMRVAVQGLRTTLLLTDQILKDGIFLFSGIQIYTTNTGAENRIAELTYIPEKEFFGIAKSVMPPGRSLASQTSQTSAAAASTTPAAIQGTPVDKRYQVSRIWADATGSFKVTATLVAIDKETVVLEKETGGRVTVPISRLSDIDQKWLAAVRTATR